MSRHPILFAFALVLPQVSSLLNRNSIRTDVPADVDFDMLRDLLHRLRQYSMGRHRKTLDSQGWTFLARTAQGSRLIITPPLNQAGVSASILVLTIHFAGFIYAFQPPGGGPTPTSYPMCRASKRSDATTDQHGTVAETRCTHEA